MSLKCLLIFFIINSLISEKLCKRCDNYGEKFERLNEEGPITTTDLSCGKSNPKEQEDCSKYGTDSGMYCCWVAENENDNEGKCVLISKKKIERSEIDGCAQFKNSYWSCGNFSEYLKINKFILLIAIFCYLMFL